MLEAGFVLGAAYLIGSYYKRDEYLRRYGVLFWGVDCRVGV
jgi:hypothetical protein